MNSVAQILQQYEYNVLYECGSLTRTLKLLGAPLKPIFDTGTDSQFYEFHINTLLKVFKPFSGNWYLWRVDRCKIQKIFYVLYYFIYIQKHFIYFVKSNIYMVKFRICIV